MFLTSLSGNSDSSNSISSDNDETDLPSGWPDNFISLGETSDHKKESVGIASQLELLKGVHQNDAGFSSDDEVEAPDFDDKRNFDSPSRPVSPSIGLKRSDPTCQVDEQLSRDEFKGTKILLESLLVGNTVSKTLDLYDRGKQKHIEPRTWSAIDKHARQPVDRYSTMGGRQAMKARSSSHCQPHKPGIFCPFQKCKDYNSEDDLLDEPETVDYEQTDTSISEALACYDGKQMPESNIASPVEADIQHDNSRYSMVERLDDLRVNSRNPLFKSKMIDRNRGRTGTFSVIRSTASSGEDIIGEEDSSDMMNSGSSTDNEEKVQNPGIAVVEFKRTMADKFQEAFASSVDDRELSFAELNRSSNGLVERLQLVLQRQKDRDVEFFKNLHTDVWAKGESRCLDVKILSRSYDGKLIVCQCSLLENEESSFENPQCENFRNIWTIIFSPRVCFDVDLEVANLVRIHPPWQEVKLVVGGEIIILAAYYSQIHT